MALKVWYLNSPWKVDKENLSRNWISTSGRLWNVDLKVFWWKNKCILVVCTTRSLNAFINGRHGMHLMSFVLLYVSSCKSGVPKLGKPRILSACLKNQVTKSAERPKVVDSRLMRRLDGTYTHTHNLIWGTHSAYYWSFVIKGGPNDQRSLVRTGLSVRILGGVTSLHSAASRLSHTHTHSLST